MVDHPIRLRAPSLAGADRSPLILQRTEDDFIDAVLGELSVPGGLERVVAAEAKSRDRDGVLKLFHPLQRTYHVVLAEGVDQAVGWFLGGLAMAGLLRDR